LKTITDQFTDGLYTLSQHKFPDEVLKEAKKCLLDYLGVTFAGAQMMKSKSIDAIDIFGETGVIAVVGLRKTASIQNAILFNGMHAHVVELDDGHRVAMMHPGAPVISALLPLVQQKNISGECFLKAIVLGYEAAVRLACALQPSLKEKGFHGTGIAGTIGATVAVATALKFTKQQLKDAIAAATTSASGILKVIKDISELKPFNAGNAAQNGYISAMLAFSGFKGPYDTLGGQLGFLSMMSDNYHEKYLQFSENDTLAILRIYRKPYAACRHCHSPIEAALNIQNRNQLDIKNIKSVNVKTYYWAVHGHEHTEIVGINSAKMSIPYSIAVALIKSKAGLPEFADEAINDKEVLSLTQKVTVEADEELTALAPGKRAAIVSITTQEGLALTQRVDYPKGEPENPLSEKELEDKFIMLAQYAGKERSACKNIIQIVNNLETDYHRLYRYLQ